MENDIAFKTMIAVIKSYFGSLFSLVSSRLKKDSPDFGISEILDSKDAKNIENLFSGRMKSLQVAIANGTVKDTLKGTALREIKQGLTPAAQRFLERNALKKVKSITGTTKDRMADVFKELADKDTDLLKVRQVLAQTFEDVNKGKLDTIATTEYRTAYSYGQNHALKELDEKLDEDGMKVVRVWRTSVTDVRESHEALEGEERDMDEAFSNGLMYPSDPSGPPEEVINCRCSIEVKEVKK